MNTKAPQKTDGVDISVLHLNKTSKCTVYDMAGDVEYLNTHSLFFSKNCLHLVVFDLSQLPIGKEIRSSDQFCRLELWFQTIACQDPNACIVVVGTHVDHPRLSPEVLTSIKSNFDQVLLRYSASHATSSERVDGCLLCETSTNDNDDATQRADDPVCGTVPHILGYFEVSGITNKNVKSLKAKLQDLISDIKQRTGTKEIPCKWVDFKQAAQDKLSSDEELTNQPILSLSSLHDLAFKVKIFYESDIVAMLRFFHSQGDVLWYEDIPEMKDVVILDPQWLSNQLCSLISYKSDVNSICEGILRHRDLPKAWCHITEENRCKLISLFRSMGLCFSISKTEDLFPCKLPVGWPDREMWPPIPKTNENQTSVVYTFSFLPPSFFPDLIVAIHKKKDSFPSDRQPLYYRFNIVYITKDEGVCYLHQEEHSSHESSTSGKTEQSSAPHRIHLEAMPHNNTVKVTIRGPRPCCMLPDIRSTIKMVQSGRFPGVVYQERLICLECEVKRVRNPTTMNLQGPCDGVCSNGHIYVDKQHVLMGKGVKIALEAAKAPQQSTLATLKAHDCPKLFVVLPINLDSLSLLDRFVYSYIRDGYAVHLICECPGQWHFTPSPGFRVGKPKKFFEKYGGRVCKMLRFISAVGTPFKIASALDPHCKAGVSAANAAEKIGSEINAILENYLEKYPHLKASLGSANDDLEDLKSARGLQRSELARFLDVAAKERDFGPLVCTYVDMCNECLWLCEEHNQQYEVIER